MSDKQFFGAVIGYGGAFNMGRAHLELMREAGITPTAACDVDPARMVSAQSDFPGLRTYTSVDELLKDPQINLVTVITPHNTHAELAGRVANAGMNVVVEKPMCITVAEATSMIEAAQKNNVTLSVYHNRRYDGDYQAMKETIAKGLIGDVFQIQAGGGHFGKPGTWWRSYKDISGGLMYDWGAHFLDWILGLVPGHQVSQVTGFLQKNVWFEQTNEDHGQIILRFDNGVAAELTQSTVSAAPMPKWRILGTKGAILDDGTIKDGFRLFTRVGDLTATAEIPHKKSASNEYYKHLAAHLHGEGTNPVTPESARRIIAVIEAAETSSKTGVSQPVAYE